MAAVALARLEDREPGFPDVMTASSEEALRAKAAAWIVFTHDVPAARAMAYVEAAVADDRWRLVAVPDGGI